MNYITAFVHLKNNVVRLNGIERYRGQKPLTSFFSGVYEQLGNSYPKFHKMDVLSQAGFLAVEVLNLEVDLQRYDPGEVALVFANAHGSLDSDKKYFDASRSVSSPALFVYTLPNIVAGEICIRHNLKGENAFFVAPELDAIQLFDNVEMILHDHSTHACLAGWIDVFEDHHDVLVYLVEKQKRGVAADHTASMINNIYTRNYGTVENGS